MAKTLFFYRHQTITITPPQSIHQQINPTHSLKAKILCMTSTKFPAQNKFNGLDKIKGLYIKASARFYHITFPEVE